MRGLFVGACLLLVACGSPGSSEIEEEECTIDLSTTYADADGDGYGDDATAEETCGTEDGRTTQGGDCDDNEPNSFPGIAEACDGLDNDCDGVIDDGLPLNTYYPDADGDGFGDHFNTTEACAQPPDHVSDDTDCDDTLAEVNTDATEICDGLDNDCDQRIDDDDLDTDETTMQEWYRDNDADGFGGGNMQLRCDGGTGSTLDGSDCDDTNADIYPGAQEVCSGVDDDCDGLIDDDDPDVDPASQTDWYVDADGDGLGIVLGSVTACEPPSGYVGNADDCDDTDPLAGLLTDWLLDNDGDGVGAGIAVGNGCYPPYGGTAPAYLGVDCDDSNPAIFPGNAEICGDGIDNNCSGADAPCGPIGDFVINDGPPWATDPPVYNCLEACALLFGGVDVDYYCSTSPAFVDNQAYVDGWGDAQYCTSPVAEDYSLEDPANPGYDCGMGSCSYSAYVNDHNCTSINYCWAR